MRPVPRWLGEIVKRRIERLRLLNLDGQPLGRSMGEVTVIWAEVLVARLPQPDPALDAPRLEAAFDALERQCERWPAPARLLTLLPPRSPRSAPPAPPAVPAERARLRGLLRDLLRQITPTRPEKP